MYIYRPHPKDGEGNSFTLLVCPQGGGSGPAAPGGGSGQRSIQLGGSGQRSIQPGGGVSAGLPRVREKSGKNKIFSRSGNCQGILKKCQGILAI